MTLNVPQSNLEPDLPRIAYFPVSFFSMIMGLSGFTLAWKGASAIFFHGMAIWSIFAYATSIAMVILSILYAVKIGRYTHSVLEEIRHPVRINFFPSFSISLLLLSVVWQHETITSTYLWIAGTTLQIAPGIQIISATLMDEWREVANC